MMDQPHYTAHFSHKILLVYQEGYSLLGTSSNEI